MRSQDENDIVRVSLVLVVCGILDKDNVPGAQTERSGAARPVRLPLGRETHRPPYFLFPDLDSAGPFSAVEGVCLWVRSFSHSR